MLSPLFYIAEHLMDTSTIGAQLGKVIAILYKVNDRAIRGTLLQKASFMAECYDKNTLNEAVFEPMCGGFSDSSAALRELTLKATAALVPHLTHPNLEKLSRYLVRLQSDPESSIRANTVIFFSKLAPHLTEVTRQKILLPAFVRAMKDPFTPCRLAALRSTVQAKTFFDPAGLASRVLPAITPQLLDPSPEVRREAFTAVDDLLFVLRQESERLATLPVPEMVPPLPPAGTTNGTRVPPMNATPPRPTTKAPAAVTASSSGSFSLTGISSWMSSSSKSNAPAAMPPPPAATPVPHYSTAPPANMTSTSAAMNQMNMQDDWDDDANPDDDGWDDDGHQDDDDGGWGDDDDLDVSNSAPHPVRQTPAIGAAAPTGASSLFAPAEDDDFFGGLDAKPAKPTITTRPAMGKLVVPPKVGGVASKGKLLTAKPAVQKLSTKDNSGSDGWDDF
jgi:SCY1-like protein 1